MTAAAVAESAAVTQLPDLQQKFHDTRRSMQDYLVERHDEIDIFLLCLAGRLNAFLKGIPGVAKSYTVEKGMKHIGGLQDGDYYRQLMTAGTTDSELFGDRDLAAMDRNERRRVLDRTLVVAKVAFIDEIFKSNSSALNAMLTILNEGVYDNGSDGTIEAPLFALFSASNEFPRGDELTALYDRLHFKKIVHNIREDGSFIEMLKLQQKGPITPTISIEDIERAQAEVDAVTFDSEVYDGLLQLRRELASEGVEPTDRTFALCLRAIAAQAWMNRQTTATVEDLSPVRWILWNRPDQISVVDRTVLNLSSELEAEARELQDVADQLADEVQQCLDADNTPQRNRLAMEVHTSLQQFAADIRNLEKRVGDSGRPVSSVEKLRQRADSMTTRIIREGFGLDPDTGHEIA